MSPRFRVVSFIPMIFLVCIGCDDPYNRDVKHTGNPGIRQSFKVIKNFHKIKKWAGRDAELLSMEATHVESDGTMNLKARYKPYPPKVEFYFVRPFQTPRRPPKEDQDQKIGTGARDLTERPVIVDPPWEEIHVVVHYRMKGPGGGQDLWKWPATGKEEKKEPIPDPKCSFKLIWDLAKDAGAPEYAVANIIYNAQGYHFLIEETLIIDYKEVEEPVFKMTVNTDCEVTYQELFPRKEINKDSE